MDVQMGYDQLRLTPGAWLDLLGPLDRRRLERRPSGGSGHVLRMFFPRGFLRVPEELKVVVAESTLMGTYIELQRELRLR